jgi:hypothetical protein
VVELASELRCLMDGEAFSMFSFEGGQYSVVRKLLGTPTVSLFVSIMCPKTLLVQLMIILITLSNDTGS